MPKNGCVAEPGFSARRAGQRRDQDAAGLGLPPGIDDRAAAVADHAVIPFPRFGIDRLADRAEQPQRGARSLLHRRIAGLHQGADRGRRGVEDVDLVLVDHLPEPRHRRIIRHAFEHQRGGAVGERPIDDVAVAGDPADVGGAPVDVAVVIVEHVLVRHRREHEIARGSMQHALRLAGRTRRVEDEQRIFRVHFRAGTFRRDHFLGLVVPDVAHRIHVDRRAGALDDDDKIDAAGFGDCRVGIGLQRDLAAAANALIGGNDDVRLAVLDAAGERIRRETAEHHGMDRADARAGEHGVSRFRNHRHVDGDAVALLDVAVAQNIGEAADLVVQFLVADVL